MQWRADAASNDDSTVQASSLPKGSSFMPSRWNSFTTLQRNTHSPYVKHLYMGMGWPSKQSISYFQGDDHHDRGFEAQGHPVTKIWSTDWAGRSKKGCLYTIRSNCEGSWNSNLPDAYRDDLYADNNPKPFAIGSADGKAIKYGRRYFAEYLTNHGKTASGHARIEGQATRRAVRPEEHGYCAYRLRADKACFFANGTYRVGAYPINHGKYTFQWSP